MSDEYRHRQIPDPESVSSDDERVFYTTLGQKIEDRLSSTINTLGDTFPSPSVAFKERLQTELPAQWEKQKRELLFQIKDTFFSILSELKLLNQSDQMSISFEHLERDEANIGITAQHTYVTIDAMTIVTYLFAKERSQKNSTIAALTHSLAHEFFHKYTADRYPQTYKRTRQANAEMRNGQSGKYDTDRGEIAAELYAIHHLAQKAKQTGKSDPNMAQAYSQRVEYIRERIQDSTKQP